MSALADLEKLYTDLKDDPAFQREFDVDLAHYVGRPAPLYEAAFVGCDWRRPYFPEARGPESFGAHKVNNTIGQALLAKHVGKSVVSLKQEQGNMGLPARRWRLG